MDPLIQTAIKALAIDVPILKAEKAAGKVVLHLYGRSQPVEWAPDPEPAPPKKSKRGKK